MTLSYNLYLYPRVESNQVYFLSNRLPSLYYPAHQLVHLSSISIHHPDLIFLIDLSHELAAVEP